MLNAEIIHETEQRFSERQSIREERHEKIRAGAILEADSPDRVRKRLQRINRMAIEAEGIGIPAPGQIASAAYVILERILGRNDLMSVRYLELAVRIARTVARVHVRGADGRNQGYGTGFLVSPRLLLTNNHVLESAAIAGASRVEFDFQESVEGKLLNSIYANFDPATFFVTDKTLDYSLVALAGDLRTVTPFGWNGLSAEEGKVIAGEYVSIIQHPSGERKQIAIRENQIIDVLESFLHYKTDTSPGSSGSPVFNDQWEIVALHHSGVPSKDAQGRILTKDGKVWTKQMGVTQIHWVANEGVRISRILKHLEGRTLTSAQAALRKQVLDSQAGWQVPSGGVREVVEMPGVESLTPGSTWTLPLQLTIEVGNAGGGAVVGRGAPPAPGGGAPTLTSVRTGDAGVPPMRDEIASAWNGMESVSGAANGAGNGNASVGAPPQTAEGWLMFP